MSEIWRRQFHFCRYSSGAWKKGARAQVLVWVSVYIYPIICFLKTKAYFASINNSWTKQRTEKHTSLSRCVKAWEKLKDARDDALAKMIISSGRDGTNNNNQASLREKKTWEEKTHTHTHPLKKTLWIQVPPKEDTLGPSKLYPFRAILAADPWIHRERCVVWYLFELEWFNKPREPVGVLSCIGIRLDNLFCWMLKRYTPWKK